MDLADIGSMTLLSLIIALVIEQYKPLNYRKLVEQPLAGLAHYVEHKLNAGEYRHGLLAWCLAAALPTALVWLLYALLSAFEPLLAWGFGVLVLYLTMGFRQFSHHYEAIMLALREGDLETARRVLAEWLERNTDRLRGEEIARLATEQGMLAAHRHVIAPLIAFALLPGPAGPVLYRLSERLAWHWGGREHLEFGAFGRFARRAYQLLDWLPVRVTAFAFAIMGDFEDAVNCWRTQAARWPDAAAGIILASGAGALGVRLGSPLFELGEVADRPELGLGDEVDADFMQSAIGLVWRTLIFCLFLLALITLGSWSSFFL